MYGILSKQSGVLSAKVSWLEGKAEVIYDPTATSSEGLLSALPDYYRGRILEERPYEAVK